MTKRHSEALLATTREHWLALKDAEVASSNPLLTRALQILRNEFLDALNAGPDTPISTPDGRAPLIDVVMLLFSANTAHWRALLTDLNALERPPAATLADLYAHWLIRPYTHAGAFDGRIHSIATPEDDIDEGEAA